MRALSMLLVLALAPAGLQDVAPDRKWIETVVPRMSSPESQLAHARRLKREMVSKKGDELVFWRKLAVEAYQAVRLFHPEAKEAAVEAAFRAGEILRSADDGARALAEFRWCASNGQGSDFRARARLEIGHLERREEHWREALEAYMDVGA
ncbi:MAG: hypothetical protein ABL998_18505, partial [Planctomycetota bacterium]